MKECDVCVLVLPCGRSAHTEAGWMCGAGKKVIAYIPNKQDPELMYKMFDCITDDFEEVITAI
jgi:nucleoside 2-deoxyribosyltransferase